MSEKDLLVLLTPEGAALKISPKLDITINDERANAEEVYDFLIKFAKDSNKEPVKPDPALVDLVKETAAKEETVCACKPAGAGCSKCSLKEQLNKKVEEVLDNFFQGE